MRPILDGWGGSKGLALHFASDFVDEDINCCVQLDLLLRTPKLIKELHVTGSGLVKTGE